MNDRGGMTLTEEEVEERLRRTLATRVGDMAAPDGVVVRPPFVDPQADIPTDADADAGAGSDGGDRRRRRLVLAVAATLLVAAGVAAAALAAVAGTDDGDADDRGTTGVADVPTTPTTATPTTATTTATSAPASNGSSCVALEFSQGDDRWITVVFDASAAGGDLDVPALLGDQWRPVEAGPHRGYIASVEPGSPSLWLMFDEGIVRLQGGGVTDEELIGVGATVTRDPSGCYTAPTPDGWSRDETALPPPTEEGGGRNPDGTFVGNFHNATVNAWYGAVWYPGWTRDDLPDDLESVTVSDGQAYIGTVAPDAPDLLQLWIVYDDGVIELQATRMPRDHLRTAGDGVRRRPGTDEFDLSPPPGYVRQE